MVKDTMMGDARVVEGCRVHSIIRSSNQTEYDPLIITLYLCFQDCDAMSATVEEKCLRRTHPYSLCQIHLHQTLLVAFLRCLNAQQPGDVHLHIGQYFIIFNQGYENNIAHLQMHRLPYCRKFG